MMLRARTLVILFADIGDSTALYERVGDVEAHALVAESLSLMREAIDAAGGTLLRTVGDAALAGFDTSDAAFRAACEMQRAHLDLPLSIRVGFHVGPVIPDGGDVYGQAVNVAARIASFARVDEITATGECVAALAPEHRAHATRLDRITIRGAVEKVEVWRIDWLPEDGPQTAIADFRTEVPPASIRLTLSLGTMRCALQSPARPFIIGRAGECDLQVDSEHASRRHASIKFSHGQFLLTDTSTNGTWLCRGTAHPVLVRRDTVVMDGAGMLGLGVAPDEGRVALLRFRVSGA